MSRFVISGCSGAGKSRLIAEMARRGGATCEEPKRRVVRAQTAPGSGGVSWGDAEQFARPCIRTCLRNLAAEVDRRVLLDRSLVGVLSAAERTERARREDVALPERQRYDQFPSGPPWPEIFVADAERRHGTEEAAAEQGHHCEAYLEAGYAPRLQLAGRADRFERSLAGEGEPAR